MGAGKKILNILIGIAVAIVFATTFYLFPLYSIIGILTFCLGVSLFYLLRFAKMIMVVEDDLGKAIESLNEVEASMKKLIEMKLYFDTPEVAQFVRSVMDSVRMARFSVNKMIEDLTNRSKQKWVLIMVDEAPEDQESNGEDGSAKPDISGKEGSLLSVER